QRVQRYHEAIDACIQGPAQLPGRLERCGVPPHIERCAMTGKRFALVLTLLMSAISGVVLAQVSPERLLRAVDEPRNWLTYSGSYLSQRYTQLAAVTPSNVTDLELKWLFQAQSLQ